MAESGPFDPTQILKTKLYPPPITPDLVPRDELLERLHKNRQRPLTLISAPAGFGKSVLASMWLQASGLPGGWVSLDGSDNDLRTFVSYVLAAIQTTVPDQLPHTQALLKAPSLPSEAILARHLVVELDQIETPFLLILDDIHHIRAQSIFNFLNALLNHPAPALHLVLVGRQDPPLPIASLRAYQRVTEIRLRDLRFSPEETARFLQQMLNRPISQEIAVEWTQNTEGWPVALHLAVLSLRHRPPQVGMGANLAIGNQFLQEYLMAEVLARLAPSHQSWLLKTAILGRFCAPLCEAICQDPDDDGRTEMKGERFIQWLQKSNLFLINLDLQNEWFRFHDLFHAELLQMLNRQLSQPEIAALHLRASQWLAENGWVTEAIEHALAANHTAAAVKVFTDHRRAAMNAEQWAQLEKWVRLFPEEVVENEPVLLLTSAHLPISYSFNYDLETLLTKAGSLLYQLGPDAPMIQEFQAEISYFVGLGALMAGPAAIAIDAGGHMIDTLPPEAYYLRVQAYSAEAFGHQMSGNTQQGVNIIQEALSTGNWPVNIQVKALNNLTLLAFLEADLVSTQILAPKCIQLASKHHLATFEANLFAGTADYFRNELTSAETHLLAVIEQPGWVDPIYFTHTACILMRLYHAQRQSKKASVILQQTRAYLEETDNTFSQELFDMFQIELALDRGDTALAHQLSLTHHINLQPPIWFWHYYIPQLTPIKLWIAEERDLARALALLAEMEDLLRQVNRKVHLISILALQALTYCALDNLPKALEKLSQSVTLAAPGKFIRNYLDLGPKMRDLLAEFYKQTKQTRGTDDLQYLAQILAAFPAIKSEDQKSGSASAMLIDPLTPRELEVLKYLASDLSTKDMALEMKITWATTRTHIKNIYAKLGVNSRYEAVYRAQEFGLI